MPALTKKKTKTAESLDVSSIQAKLQAGRQALINSLVERQPEVDLCATAMLAGEHVLFVGPPGSAKSAMLDGLLQLLPTASAFSILFTKFTTPEEVFGPISLQGLKEDKYRRITTNMLPDAHLAFCDEIFKASSAILNTLLRMLNERVFANGDGTFRSCPLLFCLAASNEWPNDDNGGKELGALFDRFLFRKEVKYVSKNGRKELLRRSVANDTCQPVYTDHLTPMEVQAAQQLAQQLPWSDQGKKILWEILEELRRNGIAAGDRRIYKAVKAARAYAFLQGSNEVKPEHLEVLAHVLWDDPTEQPKKCMEVVTRLANPLGQRTLELSQQAEEVGQQAEEQLKGCTALERDGIIEGVRVKLKEIQRELRILQDSPARNQALDLVDDIDKDWQYKSIHATRE